MLFFYNITSCPTRSLHQKSGCRVLIGGNWVATTGYEDGDSTGEPNCHFFEEGLEFRDDEIGFEGIGVF